MICFVCAAKLVTRFRSFAWPVLPDPTAVGQCGLSAKNAARSRSSTVIKEARLSGPFDGPSTFGNSGRSPPILGDNDYHYQVVFKVRLFYSALPPSLSVLAPLLFNSGGTLRPTSRIFILLFRLSVKRQHRPVTTTPSPHHPRHPTSP